VVSAFPRYVDVDVDVVVVVVLDLDLDLDQARRSGAFTFTVPGRNALRGGARRVILAGP